MSDDWSLLGPLVAAEQRAYAKYVDEKNPRVGRVYPTRVQKARKAWIATLDARNAVADRIAVAEGIRRSSVLGRWLTEGKSDDAP